MEVIMLPENLRMKLGEGAVRELVVLIDDFSESVKKQILDIFTDRFESRLVEVKGNLEKEIANTKADLFKWMFIFCVSQIALIIGVLCLLEIA
jgi:hypothetical protein